jgi:hypothetical protein
MTLTSPKKPVRLAVAVERIYGAETKDSGLIAAHAVELDKSAIDRIMY